MTYRILRVYGGEMNETELTWPEDLIPEVPVISVLEREYELNFALDRLEKHSDIKQRISESGPKLPGEVVKKSKPRGPETQVAQHMRRVKEMNNGVWMPVNGYSTESSARSMMHKFRRSVRGVPSGKFMLGCIQADAELDFYWIVYVKYVGDHSETRWLRYDGTLRYT